MKHTGSVIPSAVKIGLVICLIVFYWFYLACVTEPVMVHDAQGYRDLGHMIAEKGWKEYFISGPNREPVYPLLVALTMTIAGDSYIVLLKFLQILLLSGTVAFSYIILKRSGVSLSIIFPVVCYLAISPALVNSALSVYSEIAAYLFVLGIVWFGAKAFVAVQQDKSKASLFYGLVVSAFFVLAALVKSVYELMFYLFLIPFLYIGVKAWRAKNQTVSKNSLMFLLGMVLVFHAGIGGYKYLNKKYNGLFVLTDRAAWAFYGTAARREVPLKAGDWGIATTYKLFEEEGCRLFYKADECQAWDITTADKFSSEKNYEVMAKFPPREQNKELLKASFAKIMENPVQYVLLMGLDWVRMFFWESTRIGFVVYPDWLDGVWDQPVFAKGLRLAVGMMSLAGFIFCLSYLFCRPLNGNIFNATVLFAVYTIFWHVTLYSLFFTLPRFALSIAPLFALLVALSVHILKEKL